MPHGNLTGAHPTHVVEHLASLAGRAPPRTVVVGQPNGTSDSSFVANLTIADGLTLLHNLLIVLP